MLKVTMLIDNKYASPDTPLDFVRRRYLSSEALLDCKDIYVQQESDFPSVQPPKKAESVPQADNTGSPKLPTRKQFITWLSTFESAPSVMSVYEWMCRQLRAGA